MTPQGIYPRPENERPAKLLAYIRKYMKEHHYAPTYREIGAEFDMSTSQVSYYLTVLVEDGKIKREPVIARGIVLLEDK